MVQITPFYPLQGGLDLVTPSIRTPPGVCIAGENYDPVDRGYRRIDGFERLDGQTRPSEATYYLLNFDAGQAAISEGDVVDGATSGASGIALIDAVITSGTYVGTDAIGYNVLTEVTGVFQNDENLEVSAAVKSVSDGVAVLRGAATDAEDATWYQDAIETARTNILAVPGSGPVRGVWAYGGEKYAFRDNVGVTAGIMHKATATGWVAQALGFKLDFTDGGGAYTPVEGDTITGAISTETAVLTRVVVISGTMSGGDAVGYFIFASQSGAFQAENLDVGGNLDVATIAADSVANAIPAGGRYDFRNYNFFGNTSLKRMYGVNGVGNGFEWDGTVFVPILTGMTVDTPIHLATHKKHLFFAYPGGSLQHSAIGDPYPWTLLLGAGEIGIGEEITALSARFAGILVVFGRNTVDILKGTSAGDWVLDEFTEDAGGIEWTVQRMGTPMYLDDRGLRTLDTTQQFGDFKIGTKTQNVQPLMDARKASTSPKASLRVRSKDQYRLFWADGTGLTVYLGRKQPEIMTFNLGKTVECTSSSEDANGNEILLFGDDQGFVYQLDAGTSFDGATVTAFLRLPFNHVGTPTHNKQWYEAILEVDANPSVSLGVLAEFGYGDDEQPPVSEQAFTITGGGGFWDQANWDDFVWSAPVEGLAKAEIEGYGPNMSLAVVSDGIYDPPHTIHGLTIHYSQRRLEI